MTLVKNNQDVKEFMPKSFTDIIDNIFNENAGRSATKFIPRADICESEKNYEIHLSIPGVNKEDILVNFQEGKLTISGEKKFEQKEVKKYYAIENQYGSFKRSFYLPEKVNHENIEAEYLNGVLKINIPKEEEKILKTKIQVK